MKAVEDLRQVTVEQPVQTLETAALTPENGASNKDEANPSRL